MASTISRFHPSPHHSIVRLTGERDLATAPPPRTALRSAGADPVHEFVVEFTAVTFMDCSGLAPSPGAHAKLGGWLQLCNPAPVPRSATG
ncbi:STAS domain-containing protein [Demequina lutea]|uniref:Anti-anti-sigma factor n=1 Tax=Demequina lutea TaxID=431489 RepID=A0A7Y9ZDB4_9MICO|nr:anti-anti-sigma factor [Demequina lutea]